MLQPGDKAPPFSLLSDADTTVNLEDLRGQRVVLYFYPKDDTPGCTVEACDFRDNWRAVQDAGVMVLGVSPDGPESHRAFKEKFDLPFPLLADEDHAVAEAYGAWGEKMNYGRTYTGLIRSTFIIDPEGSIQQVFANVKAKGHVGRVLSALSTGP